MRQLEVHDAVLSTETQSGDLVLTLDPVFVHHWEQLPDRVEGIGRWQSAELRVTGGRWIAPPSAESTLLHGGWIQVGAVRFNGLIPFPMEERGVVQGRFVPRDNSPPFLEFVGSALTLELTGEPRGAERLPAEWAPFPQRR